MSDLPTFRHLIKAVNEDSKDEDSTAYSYKIIEYQSNGRFIFRPNVKIEGTKMRSDGIKLYEVQDGDRFRLLTSQEFRTHKILWDDLRASKGYTKVDDKGVEVYQCSL
jgi:hypothetical protein